MIHWMRRLLPRRVTVQREIAEEIAHHLAERTSALMAQGVPPEEARARAEREFGDLAEARRELVAIDRRHARALEARAWRTDVAGDLRHAFRIFRRSPGFSVLLILIIALATGANSASFTVLRATLVNGLPYAEPAQLVHLWEVGRDPADRREASYPDYMDWREETGVFTGLEGYDQTNITIPTQDGAEMRRGAYVTPGFLSLLGIRPVLGRDFHPDETGSGLGIGLVSHGLWQSRYGGDPGVLDSTIVVDGSPVTIIGVLPPGFHFAPIGDADVWLPVDPGPRRDFRFNHWLRVIGRVRAEVPLGRVQEALAVTAGRIAARFPDTHEGRSALVVPLRQELLGGVQPVLVALFVAMGVVLLIACANIAGLLLARSLGREQEIQVRAALGATRWRLARQFLAESLIFTTIGTALGLLLGQLGLHRVLAALPAGVLDHLPALATSRMDWTVFGYTALIATLTGLAFGLGPMLHAFATDHSVVSSGHRSTGRRGLNRLRDVLIVGEIALTVVLLAGTALVGRSLLALLKVELGFRAEQVQTARVALAGPRYADDAANQQFFERLVQAMQELPEVTSVGAVSRLPLNGGGTGTMHLEGTPEPPVPERPEATIRIVAGDYFETLAIPLLAGRVFTARDDSSAPPAILVSRGLARRLDPSGDLVGRRIRLYFNPTVAWEIIGVVGDVRTGSLESEPPATIYMSHLQTSDNRFALVARTAMDEAAFARRVRERVASLDPRVPVYAMGTLNDVVNQDPAVATRRVPFILLSIFAGSALILAVAGLYGLVSYSVARRTRELGIRLALGAAPGQILLSVLGYGAGLALLGTAIGVGLAIWLSGLVTRLLFGVGALDPVAYGGSAALLILVTILATWIPARRATRVEPTSALRSM